MPDNTVLAPVTSSQIMPAVRNGFTANDLIKVVGWLVGVAIITASVIVYFHVSQASQDRCISDNEKSIIRIEGKIDGVNDDIDDVKYSQKRQDEKTDEMMKVLLEIKRNGNHGP